MNVTLSDPTGTPADDDKGTALGKYQVLYYTVDRYSTWQLVIHKPITVGYQKCNPGAPIFAHEITVDVLLAVERVLPNDLPGVPTKHPFYVCSDVRLKV